MYLSQGIMKILIHICFYVRVSVLNNGKQPENLPGYSVFVGNF